MSIANVVFDETHSESWTVSYDLAKEIQPERPKNSSYSKAASALKNSGFSIERHTNGKSLKDKLHSCNLFIIIHPCDSVWEDTVSPTTSAKFTKQEITLLEEYVYNGGGLLVIGEYENEKYGSNLNDLLEGFSVRLENETVSNDEHCNAGNRTWVFYDPNDNLRHPHLTQSVNEACFYRAGAVTSLNTESTVVCRTSSQNNPSTGLIAFTKHGKGRLGVVSDSDIFGDEFFDDFSHKRLWLNLIHWVTTPKNTEKQQSRSDLNLKFAEISKIVEKIKLLQDRNGAISSKNDTAERHIDQLIKNIASISHLFPWQNEYNELLVEDLENWKNTNFPVPDFSASAKSFKPHIYREKENYNFILFSGFLPNSGTEDRKLEALLFKTLWPEWLSVIEKEYKNPAFLPGILISYSSGFDSECAVFFPEMISTLSPIPNDYGVIFCNREASRFSDTLRLSERTLNFTPLPEIKTLIDSNSLSTNAFALWDLIHDKNHAIGHLPYNQFMVKRKMPYWMYALEELRVDLTTYDILCSLNEDNHVARYSKYCILFDRIFRFPISGDRVKNYDGLAGQLVFSYLYEFDVLQWKDLKFSVDWDKVDEVILKLFHELTIIYKDGVNLPLSLHWDNAHRFINKYVSASPASKWVKAIGGDEDIDNKLLLNSVLDDEFPLNLFYSYLQKNMQSNL